MIVLLTGLSEPRHQLTLSQPGGVDYAHHISNGMPPLDFQTVLVNLQCLE